MSDDAYALLIKALREAGLDADGADPLVPFDHMITHDDLRFADAINVDILSD